MELSFAEMFSGIGGFRLGLERSSWSCVWANDNDKYANKIYKKKFGSEELIEGDIREIPAKTVPDCTLLTAGFPCQAFSIAGKRKGLQDTRGTLFHSIIRVAKAKRPPLLLLENVKGLLSHDEGLTYQIIIESLEKLGYLVEWQVLNSKHFGVPQNRERVFIGGHLRGKGSQQIFPVGEPSKGAYERSSEKQVANTLQSPGHACGNYRGMNMIYWKNSKEKWISERRRESLALKGQSELCRQPLILQEHSFSGEGGRGRGLRTFEGVTPALTQQMGTGGGNVPMVLADRTRTYAGKGGNLESPKLETNALSSIQKDNLLLKDCRIRRLTPTECERLQGFPDGWTKGVSDTQRYKLLGNAVTVNVIEFLGERLRRCLDV